VADVDHLQAVRSSNRFVQAKNGGPGSIDKRIKRLLIRRKSSETPITRLAYQLGMPVWLWIDPKTHHRLLMMDQGQRLGANDTDAAVYRYNPF